MTLDYEERYFHGKPQNSFHKAVNIPDVVVFPRYDPCTYSSSHLFISMSFSSLGYFLLVLF